MSDLVCDFLVPLDSFEMKPTFLLKPQRVVQFIQGNMKVLGIPISDCLTSVLHCEKKSTKTFELPNIMNTFTKLKEKTG